MSLRVSCLCLLALVHVCNYFGFVKFLLSLVVFGMFWLFPICFLFCILSGCFFVILPGGPNDASSFQFAKL